MSVDEFERHVCAAEIAYKSGKTALAIRHAKKALYGCDKPSKTAALQIFIARAHSKLGNFKKSNHIYRGLLRDGVYIAPVIFGLFYNNFEGSTEKLGLNLTLVKSCLLLP